MNIDENATDEAASTEVEVLDGQSLAQVQGGAADLTQLSTARRTYANRGTLNSNFGNLSSQFQGSGSNNLVSGFSDPVQRPIRPSIDTALPQIGPVSWPMAWQ